MLARERKLRFSTGSSGIGPENRLLERFKKVRCWHEERARPTSPVNLLVEMSRYFRDKQLPKEGMVTEKLLEERSRYCRVSQLPKADISPVSLFPCKVNLCIPLQPVGKNQGTKVEPESLLKERSRTWTPSIGASFVEEEESRRLLERLSNFNPEQEPRLDMSEKEPESLFFERSRAVKSALHLDPGLKEMAPVRLISFRERVSRWSRERRKAETKLKLVHKGVELRSMEETRESLQEMPVKLHGS